MSLGKLLSGVFAGAFVWCVTSVAAAQESFGDSGTLALQAERLMGVTFSSQTTETEVLGKTLETTRSYTSISLLSNPLGSFTSSYSFPRFGADYFVVDNLSIGAALGYFHASLDVETEVDGKKQEGDAGSVSGVLFAPRVGYAIGLSHAFSLWPRAGVTYVTSSNNDDEDDRESSANNLALTLEAPFVISPVPHAAITLGPTLDVGLSGSRKVESRSNGTTSTTDDDHTTTEFGAQAGLLLWF